MKAPKCVNCGETMLATYMKSGLAVWLCPHARLSKLNITNSAIYCASHVPSVPSVSEKDSLVYAKTRYPKAVKNGTDTQALKLAFEQLTRDTSLTLGALKTATHETVSERALLEYANIAITLELPVDRLPQLFESAMKLGYALGQTTEQAISALVIGIGRRSWMRLDNLGLLVRQSFANDWFKERYGHKPQNMTEKTKAWMEYAINKAIEKAASLEIDTQSKKVKVERLNAQTKDASARLGRKVV